MPDTGAEDDEGDGNSTDTNDSEQAVAKTAAEEELGDSVEQVSDISSRFANLEAERQPDPRDVEGLPDPRATSETAETSDTTDTINTTETSDTPDAEATTPPSAAETSDMTDTSTPSPTTETSDMTDTTDTVEPEPPSPGDPDFQLREHWNGRTIYLPDEEVAELDLLYQQLSLEYQREYGDELPKNQRFYPAVVRAALANPDVLRRELELPEADTD